MRTARPALLLVSASIALVLLGGGLAARGGPEENSYQQVLLFSEVLSLVLDNYVDPVDVHQLLGSAYEGLLGGLDAHGAYLTADELAEWRAQRAGKQADPGISVLKAGHSLQVVAVDAGSPAAAAGVKVGDQIRNVDRRSARDLSLDQAWRLICGRAGTTVKLDLLHPVEGFRRQELELERRPRSAPAWELRVERGTAVLQLRDLSRFSAEDAARELAAVQERGADRLLVDLRNLADLEPRAATNATALFTRGVVLNLRDRSGHLIESLRGPDSGPPAWSGALAVLVNGATAGSAEALATVIQAELRAPVLGESTYGLGAEPKLYELDNGGALVISAGQWETASGKRWNGDGVTPDAVIHGQGEDYQVRTDDQFRRALDWFEHHEQERKARPEKAAA